MIKAVLFDMDGVIAETEHVHVEAEKKTLLKYGVQITEDELHRYTGTTAKQMFMELIAKYKLDTTFEKIFNEKEEIMFKLLEMDTQPVKGVIELICKLKEEHVKLAVASSSHRRLVQYVLRKLEITELFDSIITAEDVAHGKPDPEIFLMSAKRLKVSPAECLVVEDAKLGVEAAKKAGMKCLGYRNPHSGNQDLSKADIVTDDFSSLDVQKLLS
ncbi:MAG: HAD family phosphatase [Candidatus Bathyarchaeia archaeon]|jgi:beta-phosphoglucomutase family hydrolase